MSISIFLSSPGAQSSENGDDMRPPQQWSSARSLPQMTHQPSLDTPAKHTRARSRQQPRISALNPETPTAGRTRLAAAGRRKTAEKAMPQGPVRETAIQDEDPSVSGQDSEVAGASSDHAGNSADAAAPTLSPITPAAPVHSTQSDDAGDDSSADKDAEEAVPGSRQEEASPVASSSGAERSAGSDEASSASSSSEGSETAVRGERASSAAESEEEEESSSSWSSEEEDEGNTGSMNGMAQSMLAALHSLDGRQAAATGRAGKTTLPSEGLLPVQSPADLAV